MYGGFGDALAKGFGDALAKGFGDELAKGFGDELAKGFGDELAKGYAKKTKRRLGTAPGEQVPEFVRKTLPGGVWRSTPYVFLPRAC